MSDQDWSYFWEWYHGQLKAGERIVVREVPQLFVMWLTRTVAGADALKHINDTPRQLCLDFEEG